MGRDAGGEGLRRALSGIAATLLAAAAGAQPPAATPTPLPAYFVGEVVVSARPDEPAPPGATDVVDAAALDASGAATVAEALQWVPGVSVSTGARNEPKAWVRGYEQTNVLVLVDGVPVSDPYGGDLDLGMLSTSDVAQITVTRGGASTLYGPGSLGGVINVVTFQGGGPPRAGAAVQVTDQATRRLHGSAAGTAGAISWYVGLADEGSDGWELPDGFEPTAYEDGGRRVNSDTERSTGLIRLGWRPDDRSSLHASLRLIDAAKGIPFHTTQPAGFVAFARFSEWRQGTAALGWDRQLEGGGELRGQLYAHRFDNTLDSYRDPELQSLRVSSTFEDEVAGGYLIGERRLGASHRLGLALHLRDDRHTRVERGPDGEPSPTQRYRAWTGSLAVEDRVRLGARWDAVASLSVEHLDVGEARSLRGEGGSAVLVDDQLRTTTLLSPRLELRGRLRPGLGFTAAASHRGRFPTLRQLYGVTPANPDLDPQRATGVEAGLDWTPSPRVTVRANLFADRVRDLISRSGRNEPYRNQDEAEIAGLELQASGTGERLGWSLGWTALDAELTRSAEGLREVPYVPSDQLELRGNLDLGRGFELLAGWVRTGTRVVYERGERIELEPYDLVDVGLVVPLWRVEATLRVENLLDELAEPEPGFPLPGRRAWVGVRMVVQR